MRVPLPSATSSLGTKPIDLCKTPQNAPRLSHMRVRHLLLDRGTHLVDREGPSDKAFDGQRGGLGWGPIRMSLRLAKYPPPIGVCDGVGGRARFPGRNLPITRGPLSRCSSPRGRLFYAQGSGSSPSIAFADVSISCIRLSRRGINDCISGQSLAPAIASS